MKPLALLLLVLLPLLAGAQSLENYRWRSRLILLFTPNEDDPLFVEQYALLQEAAEELKERRVQVMLATPHGERENTTLFLDKSAADYYYDYFSARPYQIELILVGLDGTEKFRARNAVTPVSVLIDLIDSMPIRQQEILQGYDNKSQINSPVEDRNLSRGGGG